MDLLAPPSQTHAVQQTQVLFNATDPVQHPHQPIPPTTEVLAPHQPTLAGTLIKDISNATVHVQLQPLLIHPDTALHVPSHLHRTHAVRQTPVQEASDAPAHVPAQLHQLLRTAIARHQQSQ